MIAWDDLNIGIGGNRGTGISKLFQTRKGNRWYFGMKMHIGVDGTLGLIHRIDTTAVIEGQALLNWHKSAESILTSVASGSSKAEHFL